MNEVNNQSEGVRPNTRWQKVRAKGKRDYILKMALMLALFNFAFNLLFRILWPSKSSPQDPLEQALGFAGFQALGGLITGLVLGQWTWRANEKRYNKSLKNDDVVERTETHS